MDFDSDNISVDYIVSKVQDILDKHHKIEPKKKIKLFPSESNPDRINFACPICGDSAKSDYKKRGNVYLNNLFFKCFNCDERMSFPKLCDTMDVPVDMENRIKIYNHIDTNTRFTRNNDYEFEVLDKLIDLDQFVEVFNSRKNSWLVDIMPVQKNSHVYQYLKYERMIHNYEDVYQGVYRVLREGKVVYHTRVMINMNMSSNKLLGIQLRNLEKDKEKRFYKIVDFEELYNFINPGNHLDEMEAISYNKLSHFYNILNVDFEKTVTIFEGFLDSKFYPNSIGMVGAKNDMELLSFLTESADDLELKFFYDNDATGIRKATTMLKKGYNVFLWNKLFDKLSGKNKYDARRKLQGIVDLNDLVIASKNPNVYDSLKLHKFFAKDEFDLLYLDKLFFDRESKTWQVKR